MREQNSGPTALWSPLNNALRMADFLDILTLLRRVQSDLSTTILFYFYSQGMECEFESIWH